MIAMAGWPHYFIGNDGETTVWSADAHRVMVNIDLIESIVWNKLIIVYLVSMINSHTRHSANIPKAMIGRARPVKTKPCGMHVTMILQ